MTTPSDKILVQAVLGGEKPAFGDLYDRYAPLVRAVCYDTTQNLADAQDLAQEAFMRAYEKLGNLRNPDVFGRWLVAIARMRCREWRRQRSRERDRRIRAGNPGSVCDGPANDDRIERLREMITRLPEKERLALHTFYLQGASSENARRIMGLSRSGLYRVLERARERLGRLLVQGQEDIL